MRIQSVEMQRELGSITFKKRPSAFTKLARAFATCGMLSMGLTSAWAQLENTIPNPTNTGRVVAWGDPAVAGTNSSVTTSFGLMNIKVIGGGRYHGMAVRSDGTVVAWGQDWNRQTNVPSGLSNVVAVTGGSFYSLALKNDGTVASWGYNRDSEIQIPVGLTNVVAISGGYSNSLALKRDGTVSAWQWFDSNIPVPTVGTPPNLTNITAISAGLIHNLALKQDGTVIAWGNNDYGQTNVPPGLTNVIAIAAGGFHRACFQNQKIGLYNRV